MYSQYSHNMCHYNDFLLEFHFIMKHHFVTYHIVYLIISLMHPISSHNQHHDKNHI
jgi:hypothetical protein